MDTYLDNGLGKMAIEGMEIRSAISTGLRNEQRYETEHLFKNKRNYIPVMTPRLDVWIPLALVLWAGISGVALVVYNVFFR